MKAHITVILGYPDTNSGGSALGIALVNILKKHYPESAISYISIHSDSDLAKKAYPFLSEACPDLTILRNPIEGKEITWTGISRFLKAVRWAGRSIRMGYLLLFPGKSFNNNSITREIMNSSLVVARGTHLFSGSHRGIVSTISHVWALFPLLMALRLRIPYAMYAQSYGPFNNFLSRILFRFVLRNASLVLPREKYSYDYVTRELRIDMKKVKLVPDSVFSYSAPSVLSIKHACKRYEFEPRRYVVLVIRNLIQKSANIADYFHVFRDICDDLLEKRCVKKCSVVTQCHVFPGYPAGECDSEISNLLFNYLKNKSKHKQGRTSVFFLIDKPISPQRLMALYGGARYVISMRLHAAIFSLVARTPAIAISYSGLKAEGVFGLANMGASVVKVGDLSFQNIASKLDRIEENYMSEIERIDSEMTRLNKDACAVPIHLKQFLSVEKD